MEHKYQKCIASQEVFLKNPSIKINVSILQLLCFPKQQPHSFMPDTSGMNNLTWVAFIATHCKDKKMIVEKLGEGSNINFHDS